MLPATGAADTASVTATNPDADQQPVKSTSIGTEACHSDAFSVLLRPVTIGHHIHARAGLVRCSHHDDSPRFNCFPVTSHRLATPPRSGHRDLGSISSRRR